MDTVNSYCISERARRVVDIFGPSHDSNSLPLMLIVDHLATNIRAGSLELSDSDLESVTKNALNGLSKKMTEGFPSDDCENEVLTLFRDIGYRLSSEQRRYIARSLLRERKDPELLWYSYVEDYFRKPRV